MNLTKKAALFGAVTFAALGVAAARPAMAGTTIVTPSTYNSSGWTTDNSNGGTVSISSTNPDPNTSPNAGSLQLTVTNGTQQATAIHYESTAFTLSSLVASGNLQFDNYIDNANTTAAAHFAPAFHLYFGGYSTQLIWEAADNGFSDANPPSRDTWQTLNLANGQWYERINSTSYDYAGNTATLQQWLDGSATIHAGGAAIGNKSVTAYSLVAGSSYTSYLGRVDNVQINGNTTNFEPNDTAVAPEPSSVVAFGFIGLGVAGLMLRARKRRVTA